MPTLIGELEKITGSPSSVTQVMVRAHETRITGAALTTDELVPIPVDRQGRFEVPLRPGKAVLVLVHGGRVGEGERFPMLVEEGLGTITSAIKLASDRFDDYEIDELQSAAADMLASLDKSLVAATRAEVAQEGAEKAKKGSEDARDKAGEHRDDAEKAAGTAAADAATSAVQKADEKLSGYVTAAEGHAEDAGGSATSAGKDADRAETARQGAETIQQGLPDKIGQELETRVPAELDKHLPGELYERVPPLVASSIADDRAVADAAAAAVSGAVEGMDLMERSTAEGLIASKADQDDPRLPQIMQGEYAAVIGDGDRAALAVTLDGSVDFRRATPDTKAALMGSHDAVQASQDGDDHYVFQVSDRDGNIALAIDRSGAVDFRRVTPGVAEHLRTIIPPGPGIPPDPTPTPDPTPEPGVSSRDVWIPDVTASGLHATHLDTGKRVLLSTTTTDARSSGDAILWDEAGTPMYQKYPDEPSWRATDRTRMAFWGSSSIQESHGQLAGMAAGFGITDVMRGGLGSDRGRHILGRMGAAPFTLENSVTIPETGSVEFDATNGTPVNLPHVWRPGTLGGIPGRISHRGSRYTFSRDTEGQAVSLPAGTEFIPDSVAYRDAPAILQLGKNDISAEGASGEIVLEQTEVAYRWLRTLPEWVAVLGHHVNSNWAGDSDAAKQVKLANDLCRERYGERFIDLQAYLSSSQVWEDTGLTPTQDDLDRQAAGVMPLALARDAGAHMNDTAKAAYVNHLIVPHLNQIGWF